MMSAVAAMTSIGFRFFRRRRRDSASVSLLLASALMLLAGFAMAQQAPPAATEAPPENQPGYITQFGTWMNRSTTTQGAQDAAKDAANAAIDAATSLMRLPGTRVVTGRERCDLAPNGAPDCQKAADVICRGKGFQLGRSLDFQSEQRCRPSAWVSGRAPAEGECRTEHFVTRAVCQ